MSYPLTTLRLLACVVLFLSFTETLAQCGCTFTISTSSSDIYFDGKVKGVKPGDKICLPNGTRTGIQFKNIVGTPTNPVIITNICTGKSTLSAPSSWGNAVEFIASSDFIFTGAGNPAVKFGIEITGASFGMNLHEYTTDFTIENVDVHDTGCSGIVAKTDPSCDVKSQLGNFVLRNATFHDINITNTGCEGFYIGNSHFDIGVTKTCSGVSTKIFEHALDNIKVYNCVLRNIGNDGIQVGGATNTVVHHNQVYGTGLNNGDSHMNGIQMGSGTTKALVYNNIVDAAHGYGIFDSGGGGLYYNNVVTNSFLGAIFLKDDAPNFAPSGFGIINNTLINNASYGIYMLSENVNVSSFFNNIIVGPAGTYTYVYLNNANVKVTETNNLKTQTLTSVKFVDVATKDYRLQPTSPAVNTGRSVSTFGISVDLDDKPRPKGVYDMGAYEYQTGGPTSNAGPDQTITLPTNSLILNGVGTSATGVTGYAWTKKSGGNVTLANANTASVSLTALEAGSYVFELKVTDASGDAFDEVNVTVLPATVNQNPAVSAGADKSITLPVNATTLTATASDPDGSITKYTWVKLNGPAATLTNANTFTLSLSALVEGVYDFQVTVEDDKAATASDVVRVTVLPSTVNNPPVAGAGADKTIFTPTSSTVLTGTASDVDGTIASILWERKSGPAATLTNANTLTLTASALVPGVYVFRITATDDDGATGFDEVQVTVVQTNQSPTAQAGADKSLTLPTSSLNITGSGVDPDGNIASYSWAQISGPNTATMTNKTSATVSVSGLIAGTYRFGLTVTDNSGATGFDEVSVVVNAVPANKVPVANAGFDANITLPVNSYVFNGSGTDEDGTIATYAWTLINGPAATLAGANTKDMTASALVAGSYTFRLRVTDNAGAFDDDDVVLTVLPDAVNKAPVVNAGGNKFLTLPQNSIIIQGAAQDPDGTIASFQWTQQSGPAATIAGATTSTLDLSNLVAGTYLFQLRATDNGGNSATDYTSITVKSGNVAPVVSVGNNRTLVLPTNSISISGSASDSDGVISSYLWEKETGPSATLQNATTQTLTAADLVEGQYEFSLTVTDDGGAIAEDRVLITVLPIASNQPPVVSAGSDQTISLPTNSANIEGSASDVDGTVASYLWTQVSGAAATLINDNTAVVTVSNLAVGSYVFNLAATDNQGATSNDEITITVNDGLANKTPIVSAGQNTVVQLPTNTINLTGSASDPDGTIATYAWEKLAGPSATLQNISSASATVVSLIEGVYTFRLTVLDDKGASAFSEVRVVVFPAAVNQVPVADAGQNQSIILPANNTVLVGSASDPDGTVTSYGWSKVSGPATFTLSSATQQIVNVSDLIEGVYVFRLTVTDNAGATNTDDVTITVNGSSTAVPPVANAGGNQVLTLPTNATNLIGSGSDPDGSISGYLWLKVSGGTVDLANATTSTLSISNLQSGTYTFKLVVTDNTGLTNEDFVNVNVNAANVNKAPIANAGADQTYTIPINAVTINGNGIDSDGQITSYLWEKREGKTVTLTDSDKADVLVNGVVEGFYVMRLTVTDNSGYSDFDEMRLTITTASNNIAPTVTLRDTTLYLPQSTYTFAPKADDADGEIKVYFWRKVSGPAVTMVNPSEKNLQLTGLVQGIYKFELNVIDDKNTSAAAVATVNVLPQTINQPPVANAGPDIRITLPVNNTTLNGTATDTDGTIASTVWSKVTGPTNFTLANETTLTAQLTNLVAGTYVFRLTVTDNTGTSTADNVTVVVAPVPPNQAPFVDAGANKSLELPVNSTTLTATVTDSDGTVGSTLWKQLSGPNTATLAGTTTLTLTVSDLIAGNYTFELSATDDDNAVGKGTVIVFVVNPPPDQSGLPIVDAGQDILLILPDNETSIIGNAKSTDPDESISSYEWSQLSGPQSNFVASQQILQVTNLTAGRYTYRLTASTEKGSASDDVVLGVIGANDEIPKFFTPNNDGVGDVWTFRNSDKYTGCKVNIFNRSGIEVFAAEPYENNWTGLSSTGSQLQSGDYYYLLVCPDGREIKGALRIIR